MYFGKFVEEINKYLEKMIVVDNESTVIDNEEALDLWVEITDSLEKKGNTMYFIGNGASSMMAGHMSADATKNGGIKSMTFNETSLMTAVSNDITYECVYEFPVKRFCEEGDVLVTISSSGNSPNIVKAIEAAKNKGLKVITLSGLKEDNKSKKIGDLNFYIPAETYGIVEVCHQGLLHCWLDKYLDEKKGGRI